MEVRETSVQRIRGIRTAPLLAGWLFRQKSAAGLGCVPMVKFMHRHLLSGAAEKAVLLRRGGDVAEPGQLPRVKAVPGQRTHHGVACDGLCQVHKAAALGDTGHPRVYDLPKLPAQDMVFRQLCRVQLRVTAAQVQTLYAIGKPFVRQRAEGYQLRTQLPQQVETVLIVKAERPVPRHADTHRRACLRQHRRRKSKGRRGSRDFQQSGYVQRFSASAASLRSFSCRSATSSAVMSPKWRLSSAHSGRRGR